jgi:microcystin-dependent protein
MLPINVRIASARYANPQNTAVFVLLTNGESWTVFPNNGSGQANVLADWVVGGGSISPFVPPVPGGVNPVGSLLWTASPQVPQSYLLCDGREVKRRQYEKLFRVIGSTFGDGNGTTTFSIPDLRGKYVRGWGPENALDLGRVFGSDQTSLLQTHRHSISDPGHIHTVTDLGHVHAITDPGHTHVGDDVGHNHPSTNPGAHFHTKGFLAAGYGVGIFPAAYIAQSEGLTYPDFSPQGLTFNGFTKTASANLTVEKASANLLAQVADAEVDDLIAKTGVTIDPAKTNIIETDLEGGPKTVPWNLALLPYIRF